MKKIFKTVRLWTANFFTFSRPVFQDLEYVDCILENKSYLLLSWKTNNSYKLHIKPAGYISFQKDASAYVVLPEAIEQVELTISNSWHSNTETIHLKKIELSEQIDFNIQANFSALNKSQVKILDPALPSNHPKLNPFNIEVIRLTALKGITNITYP